MPTSSTILVLRPRSRQELLILALELGNLHASVTITGNEIFVVRDGPVEEVLERLGVPWETRGGDGS